MLTSKKNYNYICDFLEPFSSKPNFEFLKYENTINKMLYLPTSILADL